MKTRKGTTSAEKEVHSNPRLSPSPSERAQSRSSSSSSILSLSQPTPIMTASVGGSGHLRAPTELGQFEHRRGNETETTPAVRHVRAHPNILRTRQRAKAAVERLYTPEAIQEERSIYQRLSKQQEDNVSFCTSFTYGGMEVLAATTETTCYLLCARTRWVFQTLEPPLRSDGDYNDQRNRPRIVSLRSHPATGQIVVVTSDGALCTYVPRPSQARHVNFGRFQWAIGPTFSCARIFYSEGGGGAVLLAPARKPNGLEVSLADDYKLLLAHRDQLVVLDTNPALSEAEMLWTTCLPHRIVTAQLSGDAHCIAVVLESEGSDAADADGVHTLERDWDDGGLNNNNNNSGSQENMSLPTHQSTNATQNDANSGAAERRASVGILYKPGPFLVHSAPVTRLSFRGRGRETSQPTSSSSSVVVDKMDEMPGNDLLLTVSLDNTAQIFGQSNWKPLTEWAMSPKTRVDWITGTAAITLGDLEGRSSSSSRKKSTSSTSKRPSETNLAELERTEALHENLTHRHSHFTSIPTHTTPVSQAGAWICEICCEGPYPSMRLSRLTYLKRGADDLSPTLFESVSGYLPKNAIFAESLLGTSEDAATLSVEGLWPIWNPFVGESNPPPPDNAAVNETLRGSAMAFLGLSTAHHPVGAGGNFSGDPQLIGTQCPPTELRLTLAHPLTGHVTILEFPLYGDKSLTTLEFGKPSHSVLVLNELFLDSTTTASPRDIESIDHGGGRLVAKLERDNVISMTWRRPGTFNLLPSNWHAHDAALPNVTDLLSNTKRLRDESLLPAPLALRPMCIPQMLLEANDLFAMILWWPDSSDCWGTPPILLAFTNLGCAVAFEIVTPLVTATAETDANALPEASLAQEFGSMFGSRDEDSPEHGRPEYEVSIVPDPELGLGLRLESLDDGQPAIAGSFKKNPTNGGILPAERTGLVTLGDELVSANGVALEEKTFDEIIATVRELGASSGPGHPMRLRFRRQSGTALARSNSGTSDGSGRRTMEQMLGVNADAQNRYGDSKAHPKRASSDEQLRLAEGVSQVVAAFESPIPGVAAAISSRAPHRKVAILPYPDSQGRDHSSQAVIVCLDGPNLSFTLLRIPTENSKDNGESVLLTSFPVGENTENVHFVERQESTYFFTLLDKSGLMRLVVITLNVKETSAQRYRIFDLSRMDLSDPSSIRLRAYNVELFATLNMSADNGGILTLWSSRHQPGCDLIESKPSSQEIDQTSFDDYVSTSIRTDAGPVSGGSPTGIIDFEFVESGYIDSNPWLFVFDSCGVTVFHRAGGSDEWLPLSIIFYPELPSTRNLTSIQSKTIPANTLVTCCRPRDLYPHLLTSIRASLSSCDEKSFLRSDWHPEALVASLCLSRKGANHALSHHVKELFLWLCSEGTSIPEDQADSPLLCAPLPAVEKDHVETNTYHGNIMDQLAVGTNGGHIVNDSARIRKLLAILADSSNDLNRQEKLKSKRTPLEIELPPMLRPSTNQELTLIWGIGELLLNPPDFQSCDGLGQLYILSASLYDVLYKFIEERKEEKNTKFVPPSVLRKEASSRTNISDSGNIPLVASSACMAALLSNSQERILQWAKMAQPKMDWSTARRLRVPFWLRSDKSLARLSEEIGQTIYREKRDVMECALFFIIARKMRTLRNLAATDRSDSGKKFFSFITTHDFSSDRGRRAAEKNAFSLLRKCRYSVASAFFLLAEPPSLQSALETIVTKLQDIDLAFMVARLMESEELNQISGSNFGGVLGGGGGYAESGVVAPSSVGFDSIEYKDWSPRLGKATKKLLVERLFPLSSRDNALGAIELTWMGKVQEAAWWLPGFITPSPSSTSGFRFADNLEGQINEKLKERDGRLGAIYRVNSMLNFSSVPLLLKSMRGNARSRCAGNLWVTRHLIERGIEVPSLWATLLQTEEEPTDEQPGPLEGVSDPAPATSSIFDSFDMPTSVQKKVQPAPTSSSIFDSFDPPQPAAVKPSKPAKSSIFDSFDVPTAAISKPPATPTQAVQSSIFDDFDVPTAAIKKAQPPPDQGMQSSIFDSFDAPNPSKSVAATPSIFDNYNVPGQTTNQQSTTDSSPGTEQSRPEEKVPESQIALSIAVKPVPDLWSMWKEQIVLQGTAQRLLREVASVLASFHGDPPDVSVEDFHNQNHPLLPSGASEILQVSCDTNGMLKRVKISLKELAAMSGIDKVTVVECAVKILGGPVNHRRLAFIVVLLSSIEKYDLAESVIRCSAEYLILQCNSFAFGFDDTSNRGQTRHQLSSIQARRLCSRLSWQLETCLWLHRSGAISLSALAFKESTIAVRLGVLLASWNRAPDAIEALIRCEPDTIVDDDEGMQLWSSLKQTTLENLSDKNRRTSSGGWEFFVDCRRSEATRILRESPTGSFIIRPHPHDNGVFTLSFKTNLVPADNGGVIGEDSKEDQQEGENGDALGRPPKSSSKGVRKDDIVQHAIVRLSDSGFRCGSFGPFTSLLDLLESVSESLPFELRFDLPPSNRVIREEGSQPSPNTVLFRKLALSHASSMISHPPQDDVFSTSSDAQPLHTQEPQNDTNERHSCFGVFLDLLVLSKLRRQLSGIAVVQYNDILGTLKTSDDEDGGTSETYGVASWILGPLLGWCRALEVRAVVELAPDVGALWKVLGAQSKALMDVSEQSIEISLGTESGNAPHSGDSILRSMIQRDSGVEFSTLRLVDGGECSMVVLFSKSEAVAWLTSSGTEYTESDALHRLERMERERVIEPIDFSKLPLKQRPAGLDDGVRYRFVDPWEVEAVNSREGETRSASLGRQHFLGFSLGKIALACESDFRLLGGIPLLELWMSAKGGVVMSRALAAVHPPWERAAGGDLQVHEGVVAEPEPFANSIRQHLYRNALFQRLELPQRFLALLQVELLDLKNLTSPGGALSLSVYALLRLKRRGSSGVLSNKTRTLDTAATSPVRLGKPTGVGPNAPASWGSVVRFRYPLPDEVAVDGTSFDVDREALFKGPPSVLQITVYEKKLLVDHALGTADVDMDSLLSGGQVEEWVPLRSEKQGINWFTRIRLTLRFELMCLASRELKDLSSAAPSVGLHRIETLCRTGGAAAHEDHKRSVSSPDLLQYLESMVY